MDTISYTAFRKNLAMLMDKVNDNHKPVVITRGNAKAAVLISLEDFKSYEETAYLMATPKNAARLQQAINQLEAGKGKAQDLIEE